MTIMVSNVNVRLKQLRNVVVKIVCGNYANVGSGVVVSVSRQNYVLTARHCVIDKTNNSIYKDINVFIPTPSKDKSLPVQEVIISRHNDCAAILLGDTEDYSPSVEVVLYSESLIAPHSLAAYPAEERNLRFLPFTPNSEGIVQYDKTDVRNIQNATYFKGMSGGGFFLADESCKHLYMSAILLAEGDNDCDNNEFKCLGVDAFNELLPEIKILSNDELCIGTHEKINPNSFHPISEALLTSAEFKKQQYITASRLEEIIQSIMNEDKDVLYISALNGLGKTRLLYEAFARFYDCSRVYYTDYYAGDDNITKEAEGIMLANKTEDGVIVVDNCPRKLLEWLILAKRRLNSDFRIIATTHEVFCDNFSKQDWTLEDLHPQDIKKEIDAYIEGEIGSGSDVRDAVEKIKKISDGYPMMAIQLVEAYKEGVNPNVDIVADLMPKIMQYDPGKRTEQEAIMRMISLFQPMPYAGSQKEAAKYILNSEIFSQLYNKGEVERNNVFNNVVNKYKGRLIECQGDWLNIRPFPLAVHLTKEWFAACSPENFHKLLSDIRQQPEHIQNLIIEDFSKHIEYMQGNESAIELIDNILQLKAGANFFNEEVILSSSGSRLLLAMSTVSPTAVACCLYETFFNKEGEWTKAKVVGSARRNIVWALEKLVFASESFEQAFYVLACLAVNENENLGNNATAQFRQLFHCMLAGTEVNLETRIKAAKRIVKCGEEYALLAVSAFPSAMQSRGFVRTGGSEKFGLLRREDYVPKTYKEIHDYRKHYVELIYNVEETYPNCLDAIAKVISDNISQWIGSHLCDIVASLLENTQRKLGKPWIALYENLGKMMRYYPEGLNVSEKDKVKQWMDASRPDFFLFDIKDVTHDFWKKDFSERNLDTASVFFAPLARNFIEKDIYSNTKELSMLIDDNDGYYSALCNNVVCHLNVTQKKTFVETVVKALKEKGNVSNSRFVLDLSRCLKNSEFFSILASSVFEQGKFDMYVAIYADNDINLEGYHHLKKKFSQIDNYKFLDVYLSLIHLYNWDYLYKLLSQIINDFPNSSSSIIKYLGTIQYYLKNIQDCKLWDLIKYILSEFILLPKDEDIYTYQDVVLRVLKLNNDCNFAKSILVKIIEIYNTRHVYSNRESVLGYLVLNYTDETWDILWKALLDKDHFVFFFNAKTELGSGFGFGEGPLFQVKDAMRKMQDLCRKYPDSAPVRVAEMAPCYKSEDGKIVSFSDYFIWLAEEYGSKNVLSSIHANLGSYYWTGSVVPHHKTNIMCYEQLLRSDKLNPTSRKWFEDCLNYEKECLKTEENKESYMRMHYE